MNILLGVTGSVAAVLTEKLVTALGIDSGNQITVISTEKAKQFHIWPSHTDESEWRTKYKKGDSILHIDLVKWADVFVIAPCSANTLAKLANGLADNLLTCCARAWDHEKKFMVVAPAMNSIMWKHPITKKQIDSLRDWGVAIIPPQEKLLACGDQGIGALAEISKIKQVVNKLNK
jgi:phosphopantothenoylcysteine decarboxylase